MDKCRILGDSRKERVRLKYVMFTDVYGISGIIHHFALLPDHRWLKPCGCRPVGRPNSILVPCEKFSFLGNAFCIRNVYCESCSSPTDNRVNNRPHPRALPPPSRLPARTWPAPSQCRSHRDRNGQLVSSTKKKKETVVSNLPFNTVLPFRAPTIIQTAFREGRHSISEMYSSHKL